MKRMVAFLVVGAVLIAGFVCAILLYLQKLTGTPMDALTIFLIAFGAVGAIALGVFHAYELEEVETKDAERRKRQLRRRRSAER